MNEKNEKNESLTAQYYQASKKLDWALLGQEQIDDDLAERLERIMEQMKDIAHELEEK